MWCDTARADEDYYEHMLHQMAALPVDDANRSVLRDEVIEGFLPLADRLARRYRPGPDGVEDLMQIARLGLIKAIDRFDPDRGEFVAYAVTTISGELKRYFRDCCWDMRVPRRMQELRLQVRTAADRLVQQLRHTPSVPELAAELGVSDDAVREALACADAYRIASLNIAIGGAEGGDEIGDLVGGPDPLLEQAADRLCLPAALSQLPEREWRILRMRFYGNMTQSEIAERVGLSQMHVSRLLARTLAALRAWIDGDTDQVTLGRTAPEKDRTIHRDRHAMA